MMADGQQNKDETLDPTSPHFDPGRALNSSLLSLEHTDNSDYREFQSLDEFREHLKDSNRELYEFLYKHDNDDAENSDEDMVELSASKEVPQEPLSKQTASTSTKIQRRFVNFPFVPAKKRVRKHVLYRIDNEMYQGPLSILCRAVKNRQRISVKIRSREKIRSIYVGFLIAFDKHWNLLLRDVDETYYRPKHVNVFRKNRKSDMEISYPEVAVPYAIRYESVNKKSIPNVELMQRHVDQLFLRGDNIVIISFLND